MTATTDNHELRATLAKYETRLANFERLYGYNEQAGTDARWNRAHMLQCRDIVDDLRALLTRTEAGDAATVGDTDFAAWFARAHPVTEMDANDGDKGAAAMRGIARAAWCAGISHADIHPQDASAETIPKAVAVQPSGYMVGSGFVAKGDYVIPNAHGVRVVNAEFARGWNEARAALQQTAGGGRE